MSFPMKIADLRIYPVKSCRGMSVERATVRERGFASDRRAMIVSEDGRFLSQRSHSKLTQIVPNPSNGMSLTIGEKPIAVSFTNERKRVGVWADEVSAALATDSVNAALSEFLGEPVYLVSMDSESHRQTDAAFGDPRQVSFADGFPYLITTTASLAALSETAGDMIPMERFRPNIVIETDTPWLEDEWTTLEIEGQRFDLVKPCTRCVITTLDQNTGEKVGQSTMQALVKTRARSGAWGRGVVFGINAIAVNPGSELRKGMSVATT